MSATEAVFYVHRHAGLTLSGGLVHAVWAKRIAVCGYALGSATVAADPMRPCLIDCSLCRAKLLEGVPVYAVGKAEA